MLRASKDLGGEMRPGDGTTSERRIMKKLLVVSVLALGTVAAFGQNASAWINFKFSAGINMSYESACNSFLCGLWNNGPYPGGCCGWCDPGCCAGGYGDYPGAVAYTGSYDASAPALARSVAPSNNVQAVGYQPAWYGAGGYYAPVGYQPYPAPSYWYGR
jgi:hypothetical protein